MEGGETYHIFQKYNRTGKIECCKRCVLYRMLSVSYGKCNQTPITALCLNNTYSTQVYPSAAKG